MMRIAFDSSALAKRYVREPGTPRVLALCAQATEVVVSILCVPEILSGLNRLRREKRLSSDGYLQAKKDLADDLAQATIVPVTPAVLSRTIELLEKAALRTLDAIHIAVATDSACDLFVSTDVRQCEAADVLGLKIERIG
jgi:predicted nucleic acid-binding protein